MGYCRECVIFELESDNGSGLVVSDMINYVVFMTSINRNDGFNAGVGVSITRDEAIAAARAILKHFGEKV